PLGYLSIGGYSMKAYRRAKAESITIPYDSIRRQFLVKNPDFQLTGPIGLEGGITWRYISGFVVSRVLL
ncbi:MAG TPA: hypothetical protein VMR98_05785, partial [Candidatus Polarisedimenticolaceae bacterium]|nr:hypothetical protein [Candidatus Polarisedimenticolaceae bacterium]